MNKDREVGPVTRVTHETPVTKWQCGNCKQKYVFKNGTDSKEMICPLCSLFDRFKDDIRYRRCPQCNRVVYPIPFHDKEHWELLWHCKRCELKNNSGLFIEDEVIIEKG